MHLPLMARDLSCSSFLNQGTTVNGFIFALPCLGFLSIRQTNPFAVLIDQIASIHTASSSVPADGKHDISEQTFTQSLGSIFDFVLSL